MKPISLKNVNYLFIILSIIPLMFDHKVYSTYVYIMLFLYFVVEMIVSKKRYKGHKIMLIIDSFATLSLLFPYKFHVFILLRLTVFGRVLARQKGYRVIASIVMENKDLLLMTIYITLSYVFIMSVIVFQIEPHTFDDKYFNAFYWGIISLSTVGYGDIYPVTVLGKFFAMVSAFFGIGLVALPTGIVSSKFIEKVSINKREN